MQISVRLTILSFSIAIAQLVVFPLAAYCEEQSNDTTVPSVMLTFEVKSTIDDLIQAYYDCQTERIKASHPRALYIKLRLLALSHDRTVRAYSYPDYGLFDNAIKWADLHKAIPSASFNKYFDREFHFNWQPGSQCFMLAYSNEKSAALHLTFMIPVEAIKNAGDGLPRLDTSSYCTATLPALTYRGFVSRLQDVKPDLISVNSESFGEAYREWDARYAQPQEQGDYSSQAGYPHGSPHVVWLETTTDDGKKELLDALHSAFGYFGDVGYTNAIMDPDKPLGYLDMDSAVLDLPPTQMFQMYRTWVGPPATHEVLLPEELIKVLEDWNTIHVGMYTLTDGDLQLFFFRGVSG